jgi:hypothetical protein
MTETGPLSPTDETLRQIIEGIEQPKGGGLQGVGGLPMAAVK